MTTQLNIINQANGDKLQRFIEEIERLEREKSDISEQIREVFKVAKSDGYDPKIMRMIIRDRKKRPHELEEEEMLLETYKKALNM